MAARAARSGTAGLAGIMVLALSLLLGGCLDVVNYPATGENLSRGDHGLAPAAMPAVAPDSLLVASYNIYLGQDIDQALADLRANPRLAGADVLLLQEVDPDGAERLARALRMNHVYWPSFWISRTGRLFGNAVLSRWPIIDRMAVQLPHANPLIGIRRVAVAADIQVGDRRLRVVDVHLSTVTVPTAHRLQQATVALDSLAGVAGPVVFGGDFNTVSRSDRLQMRRLLRKAGFRPVHLPPGATAHSRVLAFTGFRLRLDHLYGRGLTPGDGGIDRRARASDHYPVWGTFAWPE